MSSNLFRFERDANGRAIAHAAAPAHHDLAVFLTEEVGFADYVDLLLDCAAEAAKTGKTQVNTGNAYAVHVDRTHATIEHLHHKGKTSETAAVFVEALRAWRAFLEGA